MLGLQLGVPLLTHCPLSGSNKWVLGTWSKPHPPVTILPQPYPHTCSCTTAFFTMCSSRCSWLRGAGCLAPLSPLFVCRLAGPEGPWST